MGYTTSIGSNLHIILKVIISTFFRQKLKNFAFKWKITQKSVFVDLLAFSEDFSYGMYTHFLEHKNFFNLNTKKIFFNKADQKLRYPKKPIFG